MGTSFSSTRTPRYLIGDLSKLSLVEQKLYSLSHAVLNQEDPRIGQISQSIGIKILGSKEEYGYKEANASEKSLTDNKDAENVDVVDGGGIVLDEKTTPVSQLFSLLITEKPYYFSQTLSQWKTVYALDNLFSCCLPEKCAIYIVPIDNFPLFIRDFEIKLDSYRHCMNFNTLLQTFAEAFFDCEHVRLLPNVNLLESKWNITTRLHKTTKQKQYFVRDFHGNLKKIKPPDGYCIMGFSWTDLYPTEALNFVLGEADYRTKTGIFCFGRYEPKTYDPETHKDITEIDAKLLWRILKVFSHELCHLFGMNHCWYFHCSMNESNSMAEAFSQPLFLCPVCLRKLQHVLGFDVLQRYKKLKRFLTDLSVHYPSKEFKHAVNWLEIVITYLHDDACS